MCYVVYMFKHFKPQCIIYIFHHTFTGILQHAPDNCPVHSGVHRTTFSMVQTIPIILQKPKHSSRGKCSAAITLQGDYFMIKSEHSYDKK